MLAGGLKLREGFGRIVRNNILLNNTLHPHVWFQSSEDVFRAQHRDDRISTHSDSIIGEGRSTQSVPHEIIP